MKQSARTTLMVSFLLALTGGTLIGLAVLNRIISGLPDVDSLEHYVPPLVTNVYDTYGRPVGEFFTERRTTVPLTEIPTDLRNAVMAIEDTEFYDHWGINPAAIARAMVANIMAGRIVQGGSTLTQQLAKTIFLTRKKTFFRKFRELLLTLQIEYRYSKDEILQLYLNQIYFGAGAYGVEAASNLYFNKPAQELNLAESATLAGLIRSPNRYSPLRNPELSMERRATVLARMQELNFITEPEEEEANSAPPAAEGAGRHARHAPYFLEEVKKLLEPVYGTQQLEQGGMSIYTTLDLDMQIAAENVLEKHLSDFDMQFATDTLAEYIEDFQKNATPEQLDPESTSYVEISTVPPQIQGAIVALDVHTGAIRAMVGGRNFYESQFNRATQAKRQPGSSFKPFVWAAALEGRFTPATIIDDYPLVYIDMMSDPMLLAETTSYAQTEVAIIENLKMNATDYDELDEEEIEELRKRYWRPMNYDHKFQGPMTMRRGLEKSRNIISVRIIDSIGPRAVVQMARKAGVESWLNPVLSLSLGTSVLTPMELVNAYATWASGGLHSEPFYIERVVDRKGKILTENSPQVEARISPQTSFLITNLLRGVVQRGTGWYAKRLRRDMGGKTGTTQDQRDLWFVGFTPDLAAVVWVGYDDFRPLKNGLSSSRIAVPLWTDFMREALKNFPKSEFPIPPDIEFAKIDADTGYLALPSSKNVILEAFRKGTVPQEFWPEDSPPVIEKDLGIIDE